MQRIDFEQARALIVPTGATKLQSEQSSAVVYTYDCAGRAYALGFFGKSSKPCFHNRFGSAEHRNRHCAEFLADMDGVEKRANEHKAERAAKLAQPQDQIKVGDVLYTSWGYEQTNIDAYQVVSLIGKRTIELREIACERREDLHMQGECTPVRGAFIGKPFRVRVNEYGRCRITSFATAGKWDSEIVGGVECFRPLRWTAYA